MSRKRKHDGKEEEEENTKPAADEMTETGKAKNKKTNNKKLKTSGEKEQPEWYKLDSATKKPLGTSAGYPMLFRFKPGTSRTVAKQCTDEIKAACVRVSEGGDGATQLPSWARAVSAKVDTNGETQQEAEASDRLYLHVLVYSGSAHQTFHPKWLNLVFPGKRWTHWFDSCFVQVLKRNVQAIYHFMCQATGPVDGGTIWNPRTRYSISYDDCPHWTLGSMEGAGSVGGRPRGSSSSSSKKNKPTKPRKQHQATRMKKEEDNGDHTHLLDGGSSGGDGDGDGDSMALDLPRPQLPSKVNWVETWAAIRADLQAMEPLEVNAKYPCLRARHQSDFNEMANRVRSLMKRERRLQEWPNTELTFASSDADGKESLSKVKLEKPFYPAVGTRLKQHYVLVSKDPATYGSTCKQLLELQHQVHELQLDSLESYEQEEMIAASPSVSANMTLKIVHDICSDRGFRQSNSRCIHTRRAHARYWPENVPLTLILVCSPDALPPEEAMPPCWFKVLDLDNGGKEMTAADRAAMRERALAKQCEQQMAAKATLKKAKIMAQARHKRELQDAKAVEQAIEERLEAHRKSSGGGVGVLPPQVEQELYEKYRAEEEQHREDQVKAAEKQQEMNVRAVYNDKPTAQLEADVRDPSKLKYVHDALRKMLQERQTEAQRVQNLSDDALVAEAHAHNKSTCRWEVAVLQEEVKKRPAGLEERVQETMELDRDMARYRRETGWAWKLTDGTARIGTMSTAQLKQERARVAKQIQIFRGERDARRAQREAALAKAKADRKAKEEELVSLVVEFEKATGQTLDWPCPPDQLKDHVLESQIEYFTQLLDDVDAEREERKAKAAKNKAKNAFSDLLKAYNGLTGKSWSSAPDWEQLTLEQLQALRQRLQQDLETEKKKKKAGLDLSAPKPPAVAAAAASKLLTTTTARTAQAQSSDERQALGAKHEQKHLQPAAALPGAAASPAAKPAHVDHVNSVTATHKKKLDKPQQVHPKPQATGPSSLTPKPPVTSPFSSTSCSSFFGSEPQQQQQQRTGEPQASSSGKATAPSPIYVYPRRERSRSNTRSSSTHESQATV